jgi:hypothetical protein
MPSNTEVVIAHGPYVRSYNHDRQKCWIYSNKFSSNFAVVSFWEGTKDVDEGRRLPTIQGSPTLDPYEPLGLSSRDSESLHSFPLPASAPPEGIADIPNFGDADPSCK